ncbi:UDP-N-acetyl-D-glucosamine 6-dehydrogenase [subsurface metagenome]
MNLLEKINSKKVVVAIIGLGYVGLPLVREFSLGRIKVIGFDVDSKKVDLLNAGRSYIRHIPDKIIRECLKKGFTATTDFSYLKNTDAIIICVPTPLGEHREPDLSYIIDTSKIISKHLQANQLVILKSTTYPGTTEEIVLPILEKSGLKAGDNFNLAYSPEREDPGNKDFTTSKIPVIVGGYTPKCSKLTCAVYSKIGIKTIPVSSTRVAEAAKLLENIYRAVNIALVNELKIIYSKMDIDIFEVIEAASTKPFGFSAFYPGPGLGGHCIPIDPFYLSWKAREYEYSTRFIELAGEINSSMPDYVIDRITEALNEHGRALQGSNVLILGMAYKKNVDDMRESPSLKIMDLLIKKGAKVEYSDPYIPELPKTRQYNFRKKSIELTEENIKSYDLIVVVTDHDKFNKELILKNAKLIIDTRNMFRVDKLKDGKIYKA